MGKGKRTADQQEIHRMAVNIRKLTDEQIVERIMHERDTAYKVGYGSGRTDAINDMKKLLKPTMTQNDRLTHERASSTGSWSNSKKDQLIDRLSEFEKIGLTPDQIREAVSKCAG